MSDKELENVITQLREQKIRITDQRVAILKYMLTHDDHPTAEDVFNDLQSSTENISIATVYNNLKFLSRVTPIRELNYDDKSVHFDYFHNNKFHAVCENCQRVYDVDYAHYQDLYDYLIQETGFKIHKIELSVKGICPNCKKVLAQAEKT